MMRKVYLVIVLGAWLSSAASSQVQNINIGGSFSGSFLLSGSSEAAYEISGSPYLSETWMFGSLEMKGDIVNQARSDKKKKAQLHEYQVMISKINSLIEKLSNPDYKATGLALTMEGTDPEGKDLEYDLRISNNDFSGIPGITEELEGNLLNYLEKLRGEYEAQINEFFKINGLFRYNLYAQEFEMVYNRDTFAIVAPFHVKSISISNMKFLHGIYVRRGGSRPYLGSAYFQVLSEGKCKLLLRHDVKIKGGGGPVTFSWAGGADAFVQYQQLYYQESEGAEVVLLKKRRKSIRKLFADRSDEVEKFIRREKINIKDNAGLTRVFNYYNSLDS